MCLYGLGIKLEARWKIWRDDIGMLQKFPVTIERAKSRSRGIGDQIVNARKANCDSNPLVAPATDWRELRRGLSSGVSRGRKVGGGNFDFVVEEEGEILESELATVRMSRLHLRSST
jgi:hypothetical protein